MKELINKAAIPLVTVSILVIGFVIFIGKSYNEQFGIMTLIMMPIVVLLFLIKKPKDPQTTIQSAQLTNSILTRDITQRSLSTKDLETGPPPSYCQLFSVKETLPSYEKAVKNEDIFTISDIVIKG